MKKILFVLLLCLSSVSYSQNLILKGSAIDENNQPIGSVTCILQSTKDSLLVKSTVTDSVGVFQFDGLSSGEYRLFLEHLAFELEQQIIVIQNEDVVLPSFILQPLDNTLAEIVIKGERPLVKAQDGKLIYDIPLLIKNSVVSNALEALQKVPGIMGMGDEVQLVGASGFTILINGQLTGLTYEQLVSVLKTIPSSMVQDIEIMYSAPPQYNVRGAAINITLKERTGDMPTLQGEGTIGYSQAHYAGYGLRGSLLYTKPSLNVDLMVGYNKSKGWGDSHMYALHQFDGNMYDISQDNRSISDSKTLDMRLGLSYNFGNKDKLSMVYTNNLGDYISDPTSHTVFLQNGSPYTDINSRNDKEGNSYLHNVKAEYNSHQKLNVGVDYTFYNDPSSEKYFDYIADNTLNTAFKNDTEQKVNKTFFFINHTLPLPKEWNLNYGGNFSFSNNDNRYSYYKNPDGNAVDSVNNTKQKEYSGSIFAGFTKSFNTKLSVQASLSLNYYKASIDMMAQKKTLWDDFQPFANANLTYIFNPNNILQLSFSSDIDYPPYWALSTDQFKMNAYSSAVGNPELKFSKKYKTQLLYIKQQKYIGGMYYEYNPNFYTQLPYQSQNRLENVFQMVNLNYSKQYGLFVVVPFALENIWDVKATLTFMRQEQKDDDFYEIPYKRDRNSFIAQVNNTFNISSRPNIKLDISGYYVSGAIQGIYNIHHLWNVTAGAKWTFLKDNAELKFQVLDIFKSSGAKTSIDYMNQFNTMKIYPNSPTFSLSFTYRFNNYKKPQVEEIDTSRFGR